MTYDRGNESLGHALKNNSTKNKYGIKANCANTENPQENSILEKMNQVIANNVCTFDLKNNHLNKDDPWSGILAATTFSVCSTYHTMLQVTP